LIPQLEELESELIYQSETCIKKRGWVLENSKNIQTSDLLKKRKSPELIIKTK